MKTLTMKAKKIFLLAAMLLGSAIAIAQSGNNGTLNGDVNSDGTVDVADIVAVIDLIQKGQEEGEAGYFYLGTTQPTATNFTTLSGAVATYTSIDEAVGTSVAVSVGETLYMLCPTSWTKGKYLFVEDENGETVSFLEDVDNVTISGYSIYKTPVWNTLSTATLKITYFSVGTTAVTASNYTTVNNATTTIPTSTTFSTTIRGYGYVLAPSNKTITIVDNSDNGIITFTEQTSIVIANHKVYKTNGALGVGGTIKITLL